jgi:ring-1,2-phenylacetyl-CoA epoxidase subunit PaaD
LRGVEQTPEGVVVTVTPTYSGCPAMREIAADVTRRLEQAGHAPVAVRFALAPAWTTDWITAEGRAKLAAAGIAPPLAAPVRASGPVPVSLGRPPAPACPRCGSADTESIAAHSGTACKSLHRCRACAEPFEAVKAL